MYALVIIVLFGLLVGLMPFAVLPPPVPLVQALPVPAAATATVAEDNFRKDNIEQYIVSSCSLRKANQKPDLYPACPAGSICAADVLYYSDMTVDLGAVFEGRARKSDGTSFNFHQITVSSCDASEFIF